MQILTAMVSGRVQKAGYRGKVVTIAKAFGINGYVQNLPDGRVKVVAEGDEADPERFANALVMRNSIIYVTDIEKKFSPPAAISKALPRSWMRTKRTRAWTKE